MGRDFLPRGTGIVTRRPLILQLVHLQDPNAAEYGEFLHNGRQKMTSFDAIRAEIEVETGRYLKAKGRAVSPDPIQLTVFSPNVPNLTLVDMPGLTKIPIDGQPKSIVKELEDMARTYVKGDNAIILAVTPPTPTWRRPTRCIWRGRSTRRATGRSAFSPSWTSWTRARTRGTCWR